MKQSILEYKKLLEQEGLLVEFAEPEGKEGEDRPVTLVTYFSGGADQGTLFLCKGAAFKEAYLKDAVNRGAVAYVSEKKYEAGKEIPALIVNDARKAQFVLGEAFYDYPAKSLHVTALTGTKGKTTTAYYLQSMLDACLKKQGGNGCALLSSIEYYDGKTREASTLTTPESLELQGLLRRMADAGCTHVVMETSSHALFEDRVYGIYYAVGIFTNLTQDHLDFHKTMENYRDAKSLLFEHLTDGSKPNKNAVFNMDDPSSAIIRERTKANVLTYGEGHDNDIYPLSFTVEPKHMQLLLHTPVGEMDLELKITGEFNVYNVMGVIGAMLAEKIDKDIICSVLDGFNGVPGRFQLVEAGQPYTVIVDYAHTPDGLENVLKTARSITRGKLWVVFGCGGDRDNKKRPLMGALALELADNIVVTSDNPRTEDPELIIDEIFTALQNVPEGKHVTRLSDRREAICYALAEAADEDVILIAGKGHENYQILKDRTIHFDDKEVVMEYWSDKKC